VVEWLEDQQITESNQINDRRVEIDTRLRQDPRRTAGLENPKSKIAFRVCFYPDRLKTFIMESSFLERFDPGPEIIEPISKKWIRVQGKAQTDSKAEHTRKYVSILNRVDEHLNLYKNRCEIPHSQAGQRRHGHLDVFLRWVLVTITDYPPLTY